MLLPLGEARPRHRGRDARGPLFGKLTHGMTLDGLRAFPAETPAFMDRLLAVPASTARATTQHISMITGPS